VTPAGAVVSSKDVVVVVPTCVAPVIVGLAFRQTR
jgi:hypothetical protein